MLSEPRSHTGVGGTIGASSVPAPAVTRSVYAFGSHGPSVCSLPPGTSGEPESLAVAKAPPALNPLAG